MMQQHLLQLCFLLHLFMKMDKQQLEKEEYIFVAD